MPQMRLALDKCNSPWTWVAAILEKARALPGAEIELRLIEATLQRRFNRVVEFTNKNGIQYTLIGPVACYVSIDPSTKDLLECLRHDQFNGHSVLLVPTDAIEKTGVLAQECGVEQHLAIFPIESFIATITIGLAMDEDKELFDVFQEIVETYNKRLSEVETDLSLLIEVR